MLTGELRSRIDGVWNAFWSGGIANPLEVIEQITYLLFLARLDELHTLEENKANRLEKPMERRIFPAGKDKIGKGGGLAYEDMRWSRFKNREPREMFEIVDEHVFPFLRNMAETAPRYAHHMKDARFTIPTPALLAKVVDMLDDVPMEDRDTKGDLYEYMLGKIATAGQNGQFRTPRHIIALMVEMTAPKPTDVICDPACGTCGFLVAAGEYLREHHPEAVPRREAAQAFPRAACSTASTSTAPCCASARMNMMLHGVENPDIRYRDSLAQEHAGDAERYTLVLANPPFAGSLDYETTAKDLLADRQDQEDRAAVPRAVPAAAEARRPRGGDRAGRRAVRLLEGAQGTAPHAGGGPEARRRSSSCRPACSGPMPASPPPSCSSPRRTPAAPIRSGSTTCRRTAFRSTTSAPRYCRRRSSGQGP